MSVRGAFNRILNQKCTPVFTAISLLTTASVWVIMIAAPFLNNGLR